MPTAQEIFDEAKRQVIGENLIFPKGRLDSIKHKLVMIFYEYNILSFYLLYHYIQK